ncbi:hypothetical protein BCR39DRAFT_490262 [Naematelia encephala]|uniref:SMAD/FHA domain-containing protein n=1 Tax=Naematelia encephala TaxID=71784 RepID=A0A1Y2BL08_9TREE|nr:hypothetical protein BCR39DRAFT_490262 [Naematelia encephala]
MANPHDSWIYDAANQVYYHSASNTYAIPDPYTGQWSYQPAAAFHHASTSQSGANDREEGEVEEDVGWGALMEPEQLNAVLKQSGPEKHPAYGGSRKLSSVHREPTPIPATTSDLILRLVVAESSVLTPGFIAIIDARDGGVQIGRDRCEKGGSARVRLKEMPVSKTHAVVYRNSAEDAEGWRVVDLGSTHGTFVAAPDEESKRLSEGKTSSLPHPLVHLAKLTIGSTTFIAHDHPSWPCEECQITSTNQIELDDGTVKISDAFESDVIQQTVAMDSKERRENRESKRKREMAHLRDSLLNGHSGQKGDGKYQDRAAMRRKLHPPSPPPRATEPIRGETFDTPTPPPSVPTVGMAMLANQGWTPGTGLGKNGEGRAEPVQVEMRTEKRGLGADGSKAVVDAGPGDWRQRGKQRRYQEYA